MERPILFSAAMVRAILEGRKTQTRRILKAEAPYLATSAGVWSNSAEGQLDKWTWLSGVPSDCDTWDALGDFNTGYRPGDRLWVKETWRSSVYYDDLKPSKMGGEEPIQYLADASYANLAGSDPWRAGKTRVSIFMPRWASRLTLTVTDVRVEQLSDCSPEDARAEGLFVPEAEYAQNGPAAPVLAFRALWDDINGKREGAAWADSPWVVAISFSAELRNIDA